MKKIFMFLLAITTSSALWAYDFKSGNLYFRITSNNEPYTVAVTYTNYQHSTNYYNLVSAEIPSSVTYNRITYDVTTIDAYAFYGCTKLDNITLGNNLKTIGEDAFSSSQISTLIIPSSVQTIELGAFYDNENCSDMREFEIFQR